MKWKPEIQKNQYIAAIDGYNAIAVWELQYGFKSAPSGTTGKVAAVRDWGKKNGTDVVPSFPYRLITYLAVF